MKKETHILQDIWFVSTPLQVFNIDCIVVQGLKVQGQYKTFTKMTLTLTQNEQGVCGITIFLVACD